MSYNDPRGRASPNKGRRQGESFKLTSSRGESELIQKDLQMPLLSGDTLSWGTHQQFGQSLKMSIEHMSTMIVQMSSKILSYSNQTNQGTLTDASDQQQRKDIEDKIVSIQGQVRKTRDALHTFKEIPINSAAENQTRMQEHSDLSRKHQQHANKFRELVERFAKAVQHQQDKNKVRSKRLANEAAMDQDQAQVMGQGQFTPREELKLQEKRLASTLHIREQAQAHQMADFIQDRNETINMVAAVMRDINDLTSDIKDQTKIQGVKVDIVDEELGEAAENVEQANEQLAQKMQRERTGNKCLVWCVVVAILIVVVLIFFGFIRKDEVVIEIEHIALPEDPSTST